MYCSVMALVINCQPLPGLLDWHWAGLVYQPNWWPLIVWTCHLLSCPSSVLLLKIAFHRRGWPDQGLSPLLLSGPISSLRACPPPQVLARCVGWWCYSSVFGQNNLNFQMIPSLREVWHLHPHQRLGWWMRGVTIECLSLLRAILATWQCEGVALSLDIDSRLPIIQVTWSGSHWHRNSGCKLKLWIGSFSSGTKAHARNLINDWACASHV